LVNEPAPIGLIVTTGSADGRAESSRAPALHLRSRADRPARQGTTVLRVFVTTWTSRIQSWFSLKAS